MDRTRAVILGIAAGCVATVLLALAGGRQDADYPRPAPDFSLPDRVGGPSVQLSGLQGKVVLVNFWATWCPPCIKETPSLEAMYKKLQASGLVITAISVDTDADAVTRYVDRFGVTFPILMDPRATTAHRYGTFKYPESYLVDRQGQIVRRFVGPQDWMSRAVLGEIQSFLN